MINENEKNAVRISGGAFFFLAALQLPVLFMWQRGYEGIFFPVWLGADLTLMFCLRAKYTTYKIKVGAKDNGGKLRVYQEVPWVPLWLIPLGLGIPSMVTISQHTGTDPITSYACICVLILAACGGIIEYLRKIRF